MRNGRNGDRRDTANAIRLMGLLAGLSILSLPFPALALSELQGQQKGQAHDSAQNSGHGTSGAEKSASPLPNPEPIQGKSSSSKDEPAAKPSTAPPTTAPAAGAEPPAKPVEVLYDINKAPEPVRKMRQQLVEAAASGDPERLRALLSDGKDPTALALGTDNGDPITTIKSVSGDPDGIEVLAIILDVLSTGFVNVNPGTPDEAYVWPYFAEKPLTTLTAPEKVDIMRLVTAGDYQGMLEYGNYNFFRIGIAPDGKWKFFSAGD